MATTSAEAQDAPREPRDRLARRHPRLRDHPGPALAHLDRGAAPSEWTAGSAWLLSSGDYAVTIFFVVSGFLATRSMLRELDRDRAGSARA